MVVLPALPDTRWQVRDIARGFLDHYLEHRDRMSDYENLARHPDPADFPLKKVVAKLKAMPLHFLSNKGTDFFVLEKQAGVFRLKPHMVNAWNQPNFKRMMRERLEFGLIRYFDRRLSQE